MEYPLDIEETLKTNFKQVYIIPASAMATELGNARAANVVLMGAFSTLMAIDEAIWLQCLLARLPKKLHDLNKKAFAAGRQSI
jgi:indolepyruvate ferredoxin oxidoreductase beta subunit